MTSNEIVTQLRQEVNKINPSLAFQDAEIWRSFTTARTRVYKNELSKRNLISRLAYHKFCIEMVDANDNECCVSSCKVKKSKHQIPSYVLSNNVGLKVLNLKNKQLPQVPSDCVEDTLKFMPGYKNETPYDIINGFVYVFNSQTELVQLEAIWTNPLELLFIQKCTNDNCLQDNKELIQIDESLLRDMFNITIQSLNPSLQIPANVTGDNNEQT